MRAPFGGVRVITTHLEYYGTLKRTAQVEALRAIYAEGSGHARSGQIVETGGGPFHDYPRPAATIITGDFNLEPDDPLHARMIERLRRRHAAAVRCVGGGASGRRASGNVQDLRKRKTRTNPSSIAISSSCPPTWCRASSRFVSTRRRRRPIISPCSPSSAKSAAFEHSDHAAGELANDLARDADPAARGRAALQRLAGSDRQLLLFVAHAWGGGIRQHMNELAGMVGGRVRCAAARARRRRHGTAVVAAGRRGPGRLLHAAGRHAGAGHAAARARSGAHPFSSRPRLAARGARSARGG